MSPRRPRPWWHGITPGGLIVTSTAAVATVGFSATACWLFVQGDTDRATQASAQAASALATLVALQARNRPDPTPPDPTMNAGYEDPA